MTPFSKCPNPTIINDTSYYTQSQLPNLLKLSYELIWYRLKNDHRYNKKIEHTLITQENFNEIITQHPGYAYYPKSGKILVSTESLPLFYDRPVNEAKNIYHNGQRLFTNQQVSQITNLKKGTINYHYWKHAVKDVDYYLLKDVDNHNLVGNSNHLFTQHFIDSLLTPIPVKPKVVKPKPVNPRGYHKKSLRRHISNYYSIDLAYHYLSLDPDTVPRREVKEIKRLPPPINKTPDSGSQLYSTKLNSQFIDWVTNGKDWSLLYDEIDKIFMI